MEIKDNVLSNKKCKALIKTFDNSLNITPYFNRHRIPYTDTHLIKTIAKKFKIKELLNPDYMEIVKWPNASFMDPHYDTGDQYAAVAYLNEGYKGGETIINGKPVKPKTGRVVVFSSGKLKHSVAQVIKGPRYVVAIWYV